MHFVHDTLPQRIRFASGAAADQLAAEIVERFGPEVPTPDGRRVSGSWSRAGFDIVLAPV